MKSTAFHGRMGGRADQNKTSLNTRCYWPFYEFRAIVRALARMKKTICAPTVLFVGGLLISGCSHSSFRADRTFPRSLPQSIVEEYSYKRSEAPAVVTVMEQKAGFTIRKVLVPVPDEGAATNRSVTLEYYDIEGDSPVPVVMVLPMSGGGYTIERHFANYFASRGYAAVIVYRDKIPKDQQLLENLNPMMRRVVIDHKRVIDWLETQPGVDGKRVGIFGISLGGIKGAILAPLETRISAAIIGLAGGDVPHILVHSTEPGLTKKREDYFKQHNLTPEQAEERLRKMITRDPLVYAPYVDPTRVMLVIARYDTVVPTEKGLLLKEKMGNPETIMLPSGHYTAALSIPYIKSEAFDFFEKRFTNASVKLVKGQRSGGGFTRTHAGPR